MHRVSAPSLTAIPGQTDCHRSSFVTSRPGLGQERTQNGEGLGCQVKRLTVAPDTGAFCIQIEGPETYGLPVRDDPRRDKSQKNVRELSGLPSRPISPWREGSGVGSYTTVTVSVETGRTKRAPTLGEQRLCRAALARSAGTHASFRGRAEHVVSGRATLFEMLDELLAFIRREVARLRDPGVSYQQSEAAGP